MKKSPKTKTSHITEVLPLKHLMKLCKSHKGYHAAEDKFLSLTEDYVSNLDSISTKYIKRSEVLSFLSAIPTYHKYKNLVALRDKASGDEKKLLARKATAMWKEEPLSGYKQQRALFEKFRQDPKNENDLIRVKNKAINKKLYDDHSLEIDPDDARWVMPIDEAFREISFILVRSPSFPDPLKANDMNTLLSERYFGLSTPMLELYLKACNFGYEEFLNDPDFQFTQTQQSQKSQEGEDSDSDCAEFGNEVDLELSQLTSSDQLPIRSSEMVARRKESADMVPEAPLQDKKGDAVGTMSTQEAEFTDDDNEDPSKSSVKSSVKEFTDDEEDQASNPSEERVDIEKIEMTPSKNKKSTSRLKLPRGKKGKGSNSSPEDSSSRHINAASTSQEKGNSSNHAKETSGSGGGGKKRESHSSSEKNLNNGRIPRKENINKGMTEVVDEPLSLSTLGTHRKMHSVVFDLFVTSVHFDSNKVPKADQLPEPFKVKHFNYTFLICDLGTQKCWFYHLGIDKKTLLLSIMERLEEIFGNDGWPQFVSYFNYGKTFNLRRYTLRRDGVLSFDSQLKTIENEVDNNFYQVKLHESIFYSKNSFLSTAFEADRQTVILNLSMSQDANELIIQKKRDFSSNLKDRFQMLCEQKINSAVRNIQTQGMEYGAVHPRFCFGKATLRVNSEDRTWYGSATQLAALKPEGKSDRISPYENYFEKPNIHCSIQSSRYQSFSSVNSWSHDAILKTDKTGFADYGKLGNGRFKTYDLKKLQISSPYVRDLGYPPRKAPSDYGNNCQTLCPFTHKDFDPEAFRTTSMIVLPVGFRNKTRTRCGMNAMFRLLLQFDELFVFIRKLHDDISVTVKREEVPHSKFISTYPLLTVVAHTMVNIQIAECQLERENKVIELNEMTKMFEIVTSDNKNYSLDTSQFQDSTQYLITFLTQLEKEARRFHKNNKERVAQLEGMFKNEHEFLHSCCVHTDLKIHKRERADDAWFHELKIPTPDQKLGNFENLTSFEIRRDDLGNILCLNLLDLIVLHNNNWNTIHEDGKCSKAQSRLALGNQNIGFKLKPTKPCELREEYSYRYDSKYLMFSIIRYKGKVERRGTTSRVQTVYRNINVNIPGDLLIMKSDPTCSRHFKFLGAICHVGNHFVNLMIHQGKFVQVSDEKFTFLDEVEFNKLLTEKAVLVSYENMGKVTDREYDLVKVTVSNKKLNLSALQKLSKPFEFSSQQLPYSLCLPEVLKELGKEMDSPTTRSKSGGKNQSKLDFNQQTKKRKHCSEEQKEHNVPNKKFSGNLVPFTGTLRASNAWKSLDDIPNTDKVVDLTDSDKEVNAKKVNGSNKVAATKKVPEGEAVKVASPKNVPESVQVSAPQVGATKNAPEAVKVAAPKNVSKSVQVSAAHSKKVANASEGEDKVAHGEEKESSKDSSSVEDGGVANEKLLNLMRKIITPSPDPKTEAARKLLNKMINNF